MAWTPIYSNDGTQTYSRLIPIGPYAVTAPWWDKPRVGDPAQGHNLWNQTGFPGGPCYSELGVGVVRPVGDTLGSVTLTLRYTGTPAQIVLRLKLYGADADGRPAASPAPGYSVPLKQQDFTINPGSAWVDHTLTLDEPWIMNAPYSYAAIVVEHVSGGDYPINIGADSNLGEAIAMVHMAVETPSVWTRQAGVVPHGITTSVAQGGINYSTASVQAGEFVKEKWWASPFHVESDAGILTVSGEPGSSATSGAQVLGIRRVFLPSSQPIWRFRIRIKKNGTSTYSMAGIASFDQEEGENGGFGIRYNAGNTGFGIEIGEEIAGLNQAYIFAQCGEGPNIYTYHQIDTGLFQNYEFIHAGTSIQVRVNDELIATWTDEDAIGLLNALLTLAYFGADTYTSEPPSPNGLAIDSYSIDEWEADPPAPPVNPGSGGFGGPTQAPPTESDDWWKTKRAMREPV